MDCEQDSIASAFEIPCFNSRGFGDFYPGPIRIFFDLIDHVDNS